MKAVVVAEFGREDVLRLTEVADPLPGPGQVQLKVAAVGVNRVDLAIRAGSSRLPITLPHILGLEFAGEITAVGPGVTEWVVGDRVTPHHQITCRLCRACRAGRQMHCERLRQFGIHRPGGYAELAVVDAPDLLRIPAGLADDEAAAVQTTYATAWRALVTRARLRPGETILISAAGGALGSAALQIAVLAGARVIATAGSDDKLRLAREQGADAVVNYTTQDVTQTVLDLTDGRGVDVVFEHVGGDVFPPALASLATEGRVAVCGGHAGSRVDIDLVELFRAEHQILGCARSSRDDVETVLELVSAGRLSPVIARTLPLDDAATAHRLVDERALYGRVVLQP